MKPTHSQEFDYIVIGSGSAGGLLTLRLAQNPAVRVLLLEAGSAANHWSIRMPGATRNNYSGGPRNWCFETEPEPYMDNRRLFQPRGKVIGGSSSINGMVYVRGHARDFDGWAENGAEGWAYQDVLPYFKRMETCRAGADEFRGGDGPIVVERLQRHHPIENAFLEAAEQAGCRRSRDYNGADQEGVTSFDVNIDRGWRSGTAATCVLPAAQRANVGLCSNARVTRILLDQGRATGVEYLRNGRLETARARTEVILSAGAFQSPQILMLSGIGPAEELRRHGIDVLQDLPGVGQNLHDHLEVHVKYRCARGMSKNHLLRPHRMLLAGAQWFLGRSGPAATTHSRVGGFLRIDDNAEYPNLQYHFWPYFLEGWSPPPHKDGYCFDVGPVLPQSRGWVKLASADPLAPPRILLNGLATERDRAEFRRGIEMTRDIAAQKAFDFCRGVEVSPGPGVASATDIDAYVRAHANSAYHPCGSCKIGIDDLAVVDSQLRVRGIEGLRVADASVMPSITNGNINAPSMMIGERAADLIASAR